MRALALVSVATLYFFLGACAEKNDKLDHYTKNKKSPVSVDEKAQLDKEFADVKYPAAVIFRGAQEHENWRVYVCLEKTKEPLFGQVVLNMDELGQKYNQKIEDSEISEKPFEVKLKELTLNYTLVRNEIVKDAADLKTSAHAETLIKFEAKEEWDTDVEGIDKVSLGASSKNHMQFADDEDAFYKAETLISSVDGKVYSLSRELVVFEQNKENSQRQYIDVCEDADAPYVILKGDELAAVIAKEQKR